jgi:hypothetical protein
MVLGFLDSVLQEWKSGSSKLPTGGQAWPDDRERQDAADGTAYGVGKENDQVDHSDINANVTAAASPALRKRLQALMLCLT